MHLGDRILWAMIVVVSIFFYLEIRGALIHLPFPLAQICSSILALLLTTMTAALELSFMDEHADATKEI